MRFQSYQERPVKPKQISAHQFKRGEEHGLCFSTKGWWENAWIYDKDETTEEFERKRKLYRVAKADLYPYVLINDKPVRVKHNEWIVAKGDEVYALPTDKFKKKYIRVV